jgi:hypothetical protein
MAYNANIPRPFDFRSVSQAQILGNFEGIGASLLGVDVGGLAMGTQRAPVLTGTNQMAFYARNAQNPAIPNDPFLNVACVQRLSNGAVTEFSISGDDGANDGWFRYPNGILVKYQLIQIPGNNTTSLGRSVTYNWLVNAGFPMYTSVPFLIQVTPAQYGNMATNYVGARVFLDSTNPATTTGFTLSIQSYQGGGWAGFQAFVLAYGLG